MSKWRTNLHFFHGNRYLNGARMAERIEVSEFLGIRSSSSLHPLRQVSTPEGTERVDAGGGEGWGLFTHGVGPLNLPLQPQASYPWPCGTLWRYALTTWLTITQSYSTHTLTTWMWVCLRDDQQLTETDQAWRPRHCLTQWDARSQKPTNRKLLFKSLKKWRLSHM